MNHFLADDGEKIHFKVSGTGRPILMLHGWTATHQEWLPFIEPLASQHRIIRWDARAHAGHRPSSDTLPTVERMARDLRNLIDHLDLHEIIAIGHSMGALTLWQYIQDFGCDRLKKVCFIDQSPKLITDEAWPHGIYGDFDTQRSENFLTQLEHDFAESVLQLSAQGLNDQARKKYADGAKGWQKARTLLKSLDPAPLIACWKSLTAADYRQALRQINIPALLIYGGASNFYHQATAHYVKDHIADAILHIYEGTDHSPHQWQRERFTQDLLEFIEQP